MILPSEVPLRTPASQHTVYARTVPVISQTDTYTKGGENSDYQHHTLELSLPLYRLGVNAGDYNALRAEITQRRFHRKERHTTYDGDNRVSEIGARKGPGRPNDVVNRHQVCKDPTNLESERT